MTWLIRDVDHGGGSSGIEAPDYGGNMDLFTIKLHFGGFFTSNPKKYVGGEFRYVDKCDVDELSLLELYSMLADCGLNAAMTELFYKKPSCELDLGLSSINCDSHVLEMCNMIDGSRIIYLYCETIQETQPDEYTNSQLHYPQDPKSIEFERQQLEDLFHLDGIPEDMYNIDDLLNKPICDEPNVEEGCEVSEDENVSFHEDSSNIDSTDEDVRNHMSSKLVDVPVEALNWNTEIVDSDFSDEIDSDGERMVSNSTDDEDDEMRFPSFNEETDMANPQFELSMTFSSANAFRRAVKNQAIKERRAVVQRRNFGRRVKFECEGAGCKWKIYASPMPYSSTYQIKTITPKHTCTQTFKQKQINSRWIAQYYENDIRMNPTWPLHAFHKKVVNDWKCDVSLHAIGRARRMALKMIKGDHVAEFGLLWDYMNEIKKTMPNSTVRLELQDPEPGQERRRFKRIYICLGPVKQGFMAGCRPLIGLDGCHLKGPYGMQLLSAVGADSNDGIYPIAWAVVEAENTESWNWFLQLVADDVGIVNSGAFTFISDRQKGLINALQNVVPNAEHRFCVMHLYNNMVKDFKGRGLRDLLWKAAKATNEYTFNKHMTALKKISKRCHDWLMEKPRSQWTRSAFRTTCQSDMFVNNHCEVFNNSIGKLRDLPIIGLLQGIHKAVMRRIQARRDKMSRSYQLNPICPNAMRKVNKDLGFSGACVVQWSGGTKYLVTVADGGHEIVVDLDARSCACRKFDLTGLPCYHACACIRWKGLDMSSYIHKTYYKSMFLRTYTHTVEPINSVEYWEKTPYPPPLPPILKVQPGRPKKKRNKKNDIQPEKKKQGNESGNGTQKMPRGGTKSHCRYCKQKGHNARTCQAKKFDKDQGGKASKASKAQVPVEDQMETGGSTNAPQSQMVSECPVTVQIDVPLNAHGTQGSSAPRPRKKKKSNAALQGCSTNAPQISNDHTQGGIFGSIAQPARPANTVLGIQPQRMTKNGNQVTTMKQLEKARNDRIEGFKKNPVWKI